jgi:nicotinate-nucleotide adenylyltransferase
VLLLPAHTQPRKAGEPDPGPEHRMAMTRRAVEGDDGLAACALEIDRGGPSYTVDSLRAIHASHPHAELTFIVGADVASTLASWREPQALLELADLAVAERAGAERPAVNAAVTAAQPAGHPDLARIRFLDMPRIEISSSLVRERVARGEPIEQLVGPAVADYIDSHGLYAVGAPA